MVAKKITSLQHPLVKHWVQLRLERAYREKTGRLLISGERMISEGKVDVLISLEPSSIEAKEKYLVTEPILRKITALQEPDGMAAEIFLPAPQDLRKKKFLVILDRISDPGNLGTILRTALALNWEGIILTPGTVDLFNDKALRAGKGAHFHLPYARMSPEEILQMGLHLYTADLQGTPLDKTPFSPPIGLILSSEGAGPGTWSEQKGTKITIPMNPNSESLNVAASGAILLYAMRPK